LNKKILELHKAPDESIWQFWEHFQNLAFQIPEDDVNWKFLRERFQHLLHISENTHELESFEPLSAYLFFRVTKSKVDKVAITKDPSSTPQ